MHWIDPRFRASRSREEVALEALTSPAQPQKLAATTAPINQSCRPLRQLASRSIGWEIEDMRIGKPAPRRFAAHLVLTALLVACGSDDEQGHPPDVADEVYVEVMTELLLLDSSPPAGSSAQEREARADSARGEILASHGVTAHEILDFARIVGSQAGRMEGLWHRITQKYDSMRVADLRRDTEARNEAEGKLGEEARTGTAASEMSRKPNAADSRDPARARSRPPRSPSDSLQQPAKALPSLRDTTGLPGG
jgi:hypothetical protein